MLNLTRYEKYRDEYVAINALHYTMKELEVDFLHYINDLSDILDVSRPHYNVEEQIDTVKTPVDHLQNISNLEVNFWKRVKAYAKLNYCG